jgi:hypothetical protein
MIESEMIHEARIVPVDGSPHPDGRCATGPAIPGALGRRYARRGQHELYRQGLDLDARGIGAASRHPNSTALHIVERFTMITDNTIQWTMAVDDPGVFTAPWKVSLLLNRSDDYQIYEYACHEGNQAIELVLRGARAEEASGQPVK